jgi:O-antigen ligase
MMNKSINQKLSKKQIRLGKKSFWLAIFLAYSYPIILAISYFTTLDSQGISIFFRASFVFFSFQLIIGALSQKNGLKIKFGSILLFSFLFIYSFRLLYDIFYLEIIFKDDLFYILSYAFGNCILPFVAISLTAKYIELKAMAKYVFYFVLLSSLSILVLIADNLATNIILLLTSRIDLETLSALTISFIGGTLLVLSIALLLNKQIKKRLILIIGITLGLFLLLLGASKGPLLFSILVLIILIIVHFRNIGLTLKALRLSVLVFILTASLIVYLIPYLSSNDFSMIARVESFIENREMGRDEERDFIFNSAWNQFMDNPILGDSYLEKTTKWYPHNLMIEVLMATGIVGFLFFMSSIIVTIKRMHIISRIKKNGYNYVYLVCFLLIIFMGQTSGGLFTSVELWALWPIILNGNFDD